MAYSTQADLVEAAGGSARLLQLADVENTGDINSASAQAAIAAAIAKADDEINTYASAGYSQRLVPFNPVPLKIRDLSAEEAVYRLMKARGMVTEQARVDHEERLAWLDRLAKGIVSVGTDPAVSTGSGQLSELGTRGDDDTTEANDDGLKGYW